MANALTTWGLRGDKNPKTIKKLLFWEPFIFSIQSGIPAAWAIILTATLQGCENHLCQELAHSNPQTPLSHAN